MDAIERRFETLLKKKGKDIQINGVASRGLFTEIEENNSYDLKKLFTEENVNQGDIINGLDTYWIVTDKDANINNNSFYKCIVTRAIHNIKIYIGNQLYEIPAIIKTQAQGINSGQYINIIDGKIILITQDNDFTKKINYNDRFIKMGSAWKVVGFTSENEGLRYLYCEKDVFDSVADDIEGEIADRWQHETKHEYVITIEPTTVTLNQGDSQQLTVSVTDNGIVVENPTLIYASLDNTICNIDETGLITTVGIGTTTISVKFENVEVILNVNVAEVVPPKVMVINGDYKLYLNTSRTYTITYDDGTAITDKTFSYSFGNTSLATITGFTGTSVTLKANNSNVKGYCDLVCNCVEDSSIVLVKNLWVRSLI